MRQDFNSSQSSVTYNKIYSKDDNETFCNLINEENDSETETRKPYINEKRDYVTYKKIEEKKENVSLEIFTPFENDYDNISETKELNSFIIKKERKYWIDVLRVFSNFMVIVVHSSSYAIKDEIPFLSKQWKSLMFWDSFGRVSVPIFIMISGILFLDRQKDLSISKLYKKYIYRIVKDILFWNLFYASVGKYLIDGVSFSRENFLTEFLYDIICGKFHMWYLYMCTGLYIITPLMRLIVRNTEALIYFLITAIGFCQIIPFIFTLFNVYYPNNIINYFDEAYALTLTVKSAAIPSLDLDEIENNKCKDSFKLMEKCILLDEKDLGLRTCEIFDSNECQQLYKNIDEELKLCQNAEVQFSSEYVKNFIQKFTKVCVKDENGEYCPLASIVTADSLEGFVLDNKKSENEILADVYSLNCASDKCREATVDFIEYNREILKEKTKNLHIMTTN
ncbi:hypothetical protein PIROE2DRAFT_68555 [Piromyces sp. E2]|nr:hypothetical protein PIROE2DRAFT_68555 [Piromyces sp. E2]|eukprot:OUM69397.1 hypothetical protein PIROE2DRAFT_68555 [Piromyces sp. E2]